MYADDAPTRGAELQQVAAQWEPNEFIRQMLAPNRQVWCYIKECKSLVNFFSFQALVAGHKPAA